MGTESLALHITVLVKHESSLSTKISWKDDNLLKTKLMFRIHAAVLLLKIFLKILAAYYSKITLITYFEHTTTFK